MTWQQVVAPYFKVTCLADFFFFLDLFVDVLGGYLFVSDATGAVSIFTF